MEKRTIKQTINDFKNEVRQSLHTNKTDKGRTRKQIDTSRLVPTGSTELNLACSNNMDGGFLLGTIINIIGDSHSGKTLLALTCLAESVTKFKTHRLIYDEPEAALEFDLRYLFGPRLPRKIEMDIRSHTVLDFYGNVSDAVKRGDPFIYVLDSLDAVTTEEDVAVMDKAVEAKREGKEIKGSYKMTKAKAMSELFRNLTKGIDGTDALLMVISQTRQNINPMSMTPKTRSGGDALRFYSSLEMWLAPRKPHKKGDHVIGNRVRVKITKNKLTGQKREAHFDAYYDYGIDDIGYSADWLVENKVWKKPKQSIVASPLFNKPMTKARLIAAIENEGKEEQVRGLVNKKWMEIEESLRLNRKPKFG